MNKTRFLDTLRVCLAGFPPEEAERTLAFYAESIDDRIEDGLSEEEAVAAMGSPEEIARELAGSLPFGTIVRERVRTGGMPLLLLILGAPLWIPLLVAAAVVVFAVYISIWSLFTAAVSVLFAFGITAVILLVYGAARCFTLGFYPSLMVFGLALISAGLALLIAPLYGPISKGLFRLTRRFGRWMKGRLLKGGRKG